MTTPTPQSSNTQCPPPLEDVLRIYFHHLESRGRSNGGPDAAVARNLVINLQRENAGDGQIYKELKALSPDAGCPLARYITDSSYITARRSEQVLKRQADEVWLVALKLSLPTNRDVLRLWKRPLTSRLCGCVDTFTKGAPGR